MIEKHGHALNHAQVVQLPSSRVERVSRRFSAIEDVSVHFPSNLPPPQQFEEERDWLGKARLDYIAGVRERFQQKETKVIAISKGGIGDKIVAARAAFAAARAMPESNVRLILSDDIALIEYLDRPDNMSFEPPADRTQRHSAYDVFLHYLGTDVVDDSIGMLQQVSHFNFEWGDSGYLFNAQDRQSYGFFRAMGLPIRPIDMNRSIFRADQLPDKPVRDILLIPEAKEQIARKATATRSLKSIDPPVWEKIFKTMKKNGFSGRIGIVEGHIYKDYVLHVLKSLQAAGISSELVSTPNLARLCEEVAQSGMVVGMDTGPMHLAGEVIKAVARDQGRRIGFRHIFNTLAASYWSYSIQFDAQLGIDAQVIKPKDLKVPPRYPSDDISNLPPDDVARFILKDQ